MGRFASVRVRVSKLDGIVGTSGYRFDTPLSRAGVLGWKFSATTELAGHETLELEPRAEPVSDQAVELPGILLEPDRAARNAVQAAAIDVEEDGRADGRPVGVDDDLDVRDRADPHPVERDGRSDVEPLERAVEVGDVRLPWSEEESVAAQHEDARNREEHGPEDERADDGLIRLAPHGPRPSPCRRA